MRQFKSIQYLRAIAALLVVFHHARTPFPGLFDPLSGVRAGQAGVDIFFVISGFIMYSTARDAAPLRFIWRRVARVVPLYWIATLAFCAVSVLFTGQELTAAIVGDIAQSMLFIPHFSTQYPHEIWPYLIPGWTLNFEMFFYLIFAIGLATKRLIPVLVVTLLAFVIAGRIVKWDVAFWWTYTNPVLLEFLAGVLIAWWTRDGLSLRWAILLPIGVAAIALSELAEGARLVLWGAPAALIVVGLIAIERNGRAPHLRFLGLLGDASYSIYLFQMIAIAAAEAVIRWAPLHGPVQLAAMLALSFAASIGLGIVAYRTLEKPITDALSMRRRHLNQPSPASAA